MATAVLMIDEQTRTLGCEVARAMRKPFLIMLTLLIIVPATARAQDDASKQLSQEERMVRDGMAEALDRRLRGGRSTNELEKLARAYRNRARKERKSAKRHPLYEEAQKRYQKWINALARSTEDDAAKRDVDLAGARVEFAGMILSQWVVGDLDQFEITSGMRGDRERLVGLFKEARRQYNAALELLTPLHDDRNYREDEFLALGILGTIHQLRLDSLLNLGWSSYYVGVVGAEGGEQRGAALRAAEQTFQELVDTGEAGPAVYQCYLGLAMSIREQERFDEAERVFALATEEGVEPAVEAQARYELARCHIMSGKYDEARTTLAPLARKNLRNLTPADKAIQFRIYLAMLWDANSYLLEANALRAAAARAGAGRRAMLQKAKRARERGIRKMNRLRELGKSWKAVVNLYQAASIDTQADPKTLDAGELLALATELTRVKKHEDARVRLEEAASRKDADKTVAGDVLFELGKCYYVLKDERKAAQAFQDMASKYRSHPQAPKAALFAYQVWAKLAKASKRKDDFGHLADTLLNLLQSFPEHEKRIDAMWFLPVALQAATRYQEAAEQFGKVAQDSPHGEEAQFRSALCERRACEARRGQLSDRAYATRARAVAAKLTAYADAALQRAAGGGDARALRNWSAEARVHAAELLLTGNAAQFKQPLQILTNFEQRYPDSALIGRVLGARIRAHRGLRQYEEASKILEQYLQTVPAEKAGSVLRSLANGMQDEVERMLAEGQVEQAKALAAEAVPIFERLEKWFLSNEKDAKNADIVRVGLARMLHAAGRLEQADQIVATMLAANPKNGNLQRLRAQIRTSGLADDAPRAELEAAKKAWETLLRDRVMKTRAPQRYWEARYHFLWLMLRLGDAATVEKAIGQDRIWTPDLGGPPWHQRLNELYEQAAAKLGLTGDTANAPEDGQEP